MLGEILFVVLILLAALTVIGYPHIRRWVKRRDLKKRLLALCQKRGYTLTGTHPNWHRGRWYESRCDFFLETEHRIYAVKLFDVNWPIATLTFGLDGNFVVRVPLFLFGNYSSANFAFDQKPRQLPSYDFDYPEKGEGVSPLVCPILLIHPVCVDVKGVTQQGVQVLCAGDSMKSMTIEAAKHFLERLSNE